MTSAICSFCYKPVDKEKLRFAKFMFEHKCCIDCFIVYKMIYGAASKEVLKQSYVDFLDLRNRPPP